MLSAQVEHALGVSLANLGIAQQLVAEVNKFNIGNIYFCDPAQGSDTYDGFTRATAKQTLAAALALTTANQNDIVYLVGTTNAATPTTARVATGGLAWNKDNVHLIGICSGNHCQQRARISTTNTDLTTETVLAVSAHNCLIANLSVFHGIDGWTGVSSTPQAVKVTGQRNAFKNCSISGLGDSTGTNDMDVSNGSSLWLTSSENLFEDCYIGLETVPLGNNGATVLRISSAVSRNLFRGCIIAARGTHANFRPITVAANGLQDMGAYFDRCLFTNSGIFVSPGAAADGVFTINATQNGGIIVNGGTCGAIGYAFWEKATVSGKLYVANPGVGAGKAGLGTVAVGS